MIGPEVLRRRLARLDEYVALLRELRSTSLEEFLRTPEKYGAAERFLQLCIEAINDIGGHLVADMDLGAVESARDIPERLHRSWNH